MKTFDQFLSESTKKSHEEVAKDISRNWERNNPGSKFNVQFRPGKENNGKDHLYVGLIDVDKKQRRRGIASRFVRGLRTYADTHNLPISVKPVAGKGYKRKLKGWYQGHEFEDNPTKEIAPHPMIRYPRKRK
jgi:GNAT superfamily N-acetyltransferase